MSHRMTFALAAAALFAVISGSAAAQSFEGRRQERRGHRRLESRRRQAEDFLRQPRPRRAQARHPARTGQQGVPGQDHRAAAGGGGRDERHHAARRGLLPGHPAQDRRAGRPARGAHHLAAEPLGRAAGVRERAAGLEADAGGREARRRAWWPRCSTSSPSATAWWAAARRSATASSTRACRSSASRCRRIGRTWSSPAPTSGARSSRPTSGPSPSRTRPGAATRWWSPTITSSTPKAATLDLAGAHALGVERETGSLGLMTAASLKLTPAAPADPLRRVDEAELSESDRALCTRPLLLAYKYTGGDYRHSVQVTRFEEVPVLDAVADRIELTTVLTEEGQMLTQSSFMVKNNEKQFQKFKLPQGRRVLVQLRQRPARQAGAGRRLAAGAAAARRQPRPGLRRGHRLCAEDRPEVVALPAPRRAGRAAHRHPEHLRRVAALRARLAAPERLRRQHDRGPRHHLRPARRVAASSSSSTATSSSTTSA